MAPSTTPRASAPRKPRAAAVPQDRKKPSAVLAKEALPDGHDFLKPVALLRSSDQALLNADLIELFESMGIKMDDAKKAAENGEAVEQEIEVTSDAVRAVGKMADLLEQFVIPERLEDFVQLDTGKGALDRITALGMWYLERLGE